MMEYSMIKQKKLAELCVKKDSRIDELSAYIKDLADYSDTCTKSILREVCNGCRCGKAGKINPSGKG
jgi:hypothetical protein